MTGAPRSSAIAAVAAAAAVGLAAGCASAPGPLDDPGAAPLIAPDSFVVEFETTEGTFAMIARRAWSPAGVDRFHDLVRRGYYDDIVVFRVVEGYVAQFGIHGDPAVAEAWRGTGIADEPVRAANERGRVSYARGGPRTRSVQLFINLANNSPRLDTLEVGDVVGYPPIGEVIRGMDVVDAFEDRYGNAPSRHQDSITRMGNEWLLERYPELDRILTARLVEAWR